jgi:Hypervirulence associated proteins TUDOR domain
MNNHFSTGDRVAWRLGSHDNLLEQGIVTQIFRTAVRRDVKGSIFEKQASPSNPAYLIRMDDGEELMKLESELLTPEEHEAERARFAREEDELPTNI